MKMEIKGIILVCLAASWIGCGEVPPQPVAIDLGYGMRVECVRPSMIQGDSCLLASNCSLNGMKGGRYQVTFHQSLLDSFVVTFSQKRCGNLPLLDYETKETFGTKGISMYSEISCGEQGNEVVLNRGDTTVFYIEQPALREDEGYTVNARNFWIDSSGQSVVYQMYFYNPISLGYGLKRRKVRDF